MSCKNLHNYCSVFEAYVLQNNFPSTGAGVLDLVVGSSVQQQVLPSSQQLLPFLRWDLPCLRQVILFAIHFFFEKFLHFYAW